MIRETQQIKNEMATVTEITASPYQFKFEFISLPDGDWFSVIASDIVC